MNGIGKVVGESRELTVPDRTAELLPARLPSANDREWGNAQDYVSLAAYWHTVLKRRWTILTAAFVLTTIAAVVSFRLTPVYRATARVEVEGETPLVQSLTELYHKADADDAFVQTQIQVLKSDALAWKTIEQLNLDQRAAFIRPEKLARIDPEKRQERLIKLFRANLSVELVPKTRMLLVNFESPDARLAAQVATGLVNNYVDYNFRQKYDSTRQASGWLEQQLDELKARVEKSQHALVEYQRLHQIADTHEKQNVVEQMLSDVSRDLTAAQSDRIQKESLYHQVLADRAHLATLVHNELLQRLEEKAAELKGQYTEAVFQYGPNYPKVSRLQQEINENQTQIQREQQRVIERIRNDYQAALTRQQLAEAAVVRQKEAVGKVNQLLVQQNMLQREFETNEHLYQNLLQRLKDATVSAGLRSTNIHVVDRALLPSVPIRPRKLLNIAVGFLAGIVIGVMGAFAQEGLDHSVKTAEEVEALIAAPSLAVIPLEHPTHLPRGLLRRENSDGQGKPSLALTLTERPKSTLAEAYRSLGTSVLLSSASRPPATLLVTSTQPKEGKTVTTLNLAQALAQRKARVLIMDCDLRKGSIARALGLETDKGMSTVLTGAHDYSEVVWQYGPEPNLWVLPAGPVPPNPAELLASNLMAALLAKAAQDFDHVLLDSSPVLPVTDATILSSLVEGVVLVAASGATPKGALVRTCRILEGAGAHILGTVLNKVDLRHQGYYGDYGYYYYYYSHYYSRQPYGGNSNAS